MSMVTLDGSPSTYFVFDISGAFDAAGLSQILLGGGLTADNVLFNITGTTPVPASAEPLF